MINERKDKTLSENKIKEAIKTMKHWIEYEKNNKEKINKADELINIQETILLEYKRILKENEKLKSENRKLKVIRYSREYGTENIYLITKSDLVQIDINKYMVEIEDGKFVDLKQIYQENEELKERIREHTLLISPYYVKENFIPVQKVKDKIKSNKEIINKTNDGDLIHALNQENKVLQKLLGENNGNR